MKKTIFIAIAFIVVGIGAYLFGRHRPSADLQEQVAGLKELVASQTETIGRMEATILSYDKAIQTFAESFDTFRLDNKLQLERMERHALRGREFYVQQIEKLTDLDRRRNALSEEAEKFEY